MNLMSMIATQLGVKIGEEFNIEESGKVGLKTKGTYVFQPDGIKANSDTPFVDTKNVLNGLCVGYYEVVKLPYKPKQNDIYYIVGFAPGNEGLVVVPRMWQGTIADLENFYCGNCFPTKEKGEENKLGVYDRLTRMDGNNVQP